MAGLQEFISAMVTGKGMARLAKYEVQFAPPGLLTSAAVESSLTVDLSNNRRTVGLLCDSIMMPGHQLTASTSKYGTDLPREVVSGHAFEGTITATFYMDSNLEIKSYFDLWQSLAVNPRTNKVNYYESYTGSMKIFQLGEGVAVHNSKIVKRDTNRTYGIDVEEVYPSTIGEIEYAYGTTDELAKLSVEFQYKKWKTINPVDLKK